LVVLAFTAFPVVVSADAPENIAHVLISSSSIDWLGSAAHDELTLTVQMPDGTNFTKTFNSAAAARLGVNDLPRPLQDGIYHYDLRLTPRIAPGVRQALANARAQNDDAAIKQIKNENSLNQEVVQSGVFSISNGSFVSSTSKESSSSAGSVAASAVRSTPSEGTAGADGTYNILANRRLQPKVTDVVTADDAIIQGSLCVGLDCVNGEAFGFDTIRMKENNTRILYVDTSTSTGFPTHDWQLTANDSASGGAEKFSIEDVTAATVPFTVTGSSPTNSMFVASNGKVGFRNSAPGLDLHITTGDTPAIRQEQTNASGFTAQTWDIGANEANWFVRDVTGGSRLPFRIRPGAPTSSIDIAASGNVSIGTASSNASYGKLQVFGANPGMLATFGTDFVAMSVFHDGARAAYMYNAYNDGSDKTFFGTNYSASTEFNVSTGLFSIKSTSVQNATGAAASLIERLSITPNGNIGINCNAPGSQLVIASGGGCSTPASSINAGSTQFTVTSSRTFKENIAEVDVPNILDKIEAVPVVTYDFKNDGPKDRMGLIAEDFHQVFGRGDDKHIDGQDVQMALWLAVQQLTEQNKALKERLATLESKVGHKN
jgi:hypothetical protein